MALQRTRGTKIKTVLTSHRICMQKQRTASSPRCSWGRKRKVCLSATLINCTAQQARQFSSLTNEVTNMLRRNASRVFRSLPNGSKICIALYVSSKFWRPTSPTSLLLVFTVLAFFLLGNPLGLMTLHASKALLQKVWEESSDQQAQKKTKLLHLCHAHTIQQSTRWYESM